MNLWKIKMLDNEGLSIIILIDKPNLNECLVFAKNFSKGKGYMLREIEQVFTRKDTPRKLFKKKYIGEQHKNYRGNK